VYYYFASVEQNRDEPRGPNKSGILNDLKVHTSSLRGGWDDDDEGWVASSVHYSTAQHCFG